MPGTSRLGASLAASVLLHALALAVVLRSGVLPLRPPLAVIPVALVGGSGRAGGPPPAGAAAETPPAPASPAEPVVRRTIPRRPSRGPRAAPPAAVASLEGAGGGTGGGAPGGAGPASGGGAGGAGDGLGGARIASGNPPPPYPFVARRLGKEGDVVLDVLIAPDGHAAEVRVVRSSGFAPLDESALTTVRDRWRFIPARQGSTAIETRAPLTIRFRLEDVQG